MTTIPDLVGKYAAEIAGLMHGARGNPQPPERKDWILIFENTLFRFEADLDGLRRDADSKLIKSIVNPSVVDRALQALVTRRKK